MTSPDRYAQVYDLFAEACDLASDAQTRLLEERCDGDPALREAVETMLSRDDPHHPDLLPRTFDDAERSDLARRLTGAAAAPRPDAIEGFRILGTLGTGGMGVVYEAEQASPGRRVALKVMRPGMADARLLRRFEHEAQVLGRLDHPGIARIYETGTTDTGQGVQPYFAMELVHGQTVLAYADHRGLDTRQRLALLANICDALHHAHQKGVIHRDLKPANIMVEDSTGRHELGDTDDVGQPKILDFGVARATDMDVKTTTLLTSVGELVGTMPYMSPEQVAGDPTGVDIRSDQYALGVIAWELLVGRLPYDVDRRVLPDIIRVIQEQPPARLSTVDGTLRGDVETIVARTLEKDPQRRYASVADLAADIRRFLRHEPIQARPPSAAYQLSRFARRHRMLLAGLVGLFLLLATGSVVSTTSMVVARRQQRTADKAVQLLTRLIAPPEFEALGASVQWKEVLDLAAVSIATDVGDEPSLEGRLRHAIGLSYLHLGDYDAADAQLVRAVVCFAACDAADSREGLATRASLGRLRFKQSAYGAAQTILQPVVAEQRRRLGDTHPDTLSSCVLLAAVEEALGRFDDARSRLETTADIARHAHGVDHPATLEILDQLGRNCRARGDLARAETILVEVMNARIRINGDEHLATQAVNNNLAWVLYNRGRYDEARARFEQVQDVRQRLLGDEHALTLQAAHNVGAILLHLAEFDAAETVLVPTLERQRRRLGAAHLSTIATTKLVAVLRRRQNRLDEAETLMIDALAHLDTADRVQNRHTRDLMNNLGALYRQRKEHEKAMATFLDLLDTHHAVGLDEGHVDIRTCRSHLGRICLDLDRPEEALDWLAPLVAPDLPDLGWKTGYFFNGYGLALVALDRADEAEAALREGVTRIEAGLGPDHPVTRGARDDMEKLSSFDGQPVSSALDLDPSTANSPSVATAWPK